MKLEKVNKKAVVVSVIPYILLGYPWFSMFRDTWFYGGGLTVEQLQQGPSLTIAFCIAIVSSLVTAFVLSLILEHTGDVTAFRGIKLAILLWIGFVAAILGSQYTFEARTLGYFAVTAGYPLVGLVIMGAVIGSWPRKTINETSE